MSGEKESRNRQKSLGDGDGSQIGEHRKAEEHRRPVGESGSVRLGARRTDKAVNLFHPRVETVFKSSDNFKREGS